jgi:hypothetical protein
MRKITMMMVCAAAFMFIAAPIYMNKEAVHQVLINGKPLANAVLINGKLAISVDDFVKAVGGPANARVQGNKLTLVAPKLQASSSADTFTLAQGGTGGNTIHSATGGGGAGKVAVHDIHIVKTTDSASPLIMRDGKQFIWFDDVAKFFGVTTSINGGTLAPGAPVNLHVAPNPGAAIAVGDVNG